ncbi:DUF3710 domain-containing protein [Corynebacterium mastitidis]|uniref:DUF3710 domain-containing protein n=1 Tax=Corynebacterium mastitidis TaxID=161890 RepID=UPI000A025D16|nr:DUF3710 domain-containing protein [Corynebacterium mastitidis]
MTTHTPETRSPSNQEKLKPAPGLPEEVGKKRGVDFGPWDASEIGDQRLDDLLEKSKHKDVKTQRIWLSRVSLSLPIGSEIDRRLSTSIVVDVPPRRGHYDSFSFVLIVFAAPSSHGLWGEKQIKAMTDHFHAAGVSFAVGTSRWGDTVSARSRDQDVYIVGCDGPRWCARVTAYAPKLSGAATTVVRDVLESLIVWRGEDPLLAGSEMPIA